MPVDVDPARMPADMAPDAADPLAPPSLPPVEVGMPVDVDSDVADLLAGTVAGVLRRAVVPAVVSAEEGGRLPDAVVNALRSAGLFDLPAEPAGLLVAAIRQLARGSTDPRHQPAPGSAAAALLCLAAVAGNACGHAPGVPTTFADGGGTAPTVAAVPAAGTSSEGTAVAGAAAGSAAGVSAGVTAVSTDAPAHVVVSAPRNAAAGPAAAAAAVSSLGGDATSETAGNGTTVSADTCSAPWTLTGSVGADWVGEADAGATFVVVAADPGGSDRAFAVDPAAVGVTVGSRLTTTGLRAVGRATVTLDAAPATLIGEAAAVAAARHVRLLGLGATATGLAGAALDIAAHHLRNRSQFRTPLSRFPALRALIGALDRDLCAAEAAVAAATHDVTRSAGAARTAAEAAIRITGEAIQLHGGYGYITDTGVERLFRDALSLRARILGAVAPTGDDCLDQLLGPP